MKLSIGVETKTSNAAIYASEPTSKRGEGQNVSQSRVDRKIYKYAPRINYRACY